MKKTETDIDTALDMLKEEYDKLYNLALDNKKEANIKRDIKKINEENNNIAKLERFRNKLWDLIDEWNNIRYGVKPKPDPKRPKEKKCGRHSPTTFRTIFPDGTEIFYKDACMVLVKVIERIGVEKVLKLGLELEGAPLVFRDGDLSNDFLKDNEIKPIGNGWYVSTHSSTKSKVKIMKEISDKLNLNLKFEIVEKGKE